MQTLPEGSRNWPPVTSRSSRLSCAPPAHLGRSARHSCLRFNIHYASCDTAEESARTKHADRRHTSLTQGPHRIGTLSRSCRQPRGRPASVPLRHGYSEVNLNLFTSPARWEDQSAHHCMPSIRTPSSHNSYHHVTPPLPFLLTLLHVPSAGKTAATAGQGAGKSRRPLRHRTGTGPLARKELGGLTCRGRPHF